MGPHSSSSVWPSPSATTLPVPQTRSAAPAPSLFPITSLPPSATSPGLYTTPLLSLPPRPPQKMLSSALSLLPSNHAMTSSARLATRPGTRPPLTPSSTLAPTTLATSTSTSAETEVTSAAPLTSASDLTPATTAAGPALIHTPAGPFPSASRQVPSPTPDDAAETDAVFARSAAAAPATAASRGHQATLTAGSPSTGCADVSDLRLLRDPRSPQAAQS